MDAEGFLKRGRDAVFLTVRTERDLTAEAQGILSSHAGGAIGATRTGFVHSHRCWNARGLEDIVDARLHQLRNQGSATERKKALLLKMEVTNQDNTTAQLTCSNRTGSKTGKNPNGLYH